MLSYLMRYTVLYMSPQLQSLSRLLYRFLGKIHLVANTRPHQAYLMIEADSIMCFARYLWFWLKVSRKN